MSHKHLAGPKRFANLLIKTKFAKNSSSSSDSAPSAPLTLTIKGDNSMKKSSNDTQLPQKEPSVAFAYFRASLFLALQLTGTVAMCVATAGFNWMQIDNSVSKVSTGLGMLRTAGLFYECFATPEDYLRGKGSWQDQTRDILRKRGECDTDPKSFFISIWKYDWTIFFLVTKVLAIAGSCLAFLTLTLGSFQAFYHISRFGPDFQRAWNSYPKWYSALGVLTNLASSFMVPVCMGGPIMWTIFVCLCARKGKEQNLGFFDKPADYWGASFWLAWAASGVLVMCPILLQI